MCGLGLTNQTPPEVRPRCHHLLRVLGAGCLFQCSNRFSLCEHAAELCSRSLSDKRRLPLCVGRGQYQAGPADVDFYEGCGGDDDEWVTHGSSRARTPRQAPARRWTAPGPWMPTSVCTTIGAWRYGLSSHLPSPVVLRPGQIWPPSSRLRYQKYLLLTVKGKNYTSKKTRGETYTTW